MYKTTKAYFEPEPMPCAWQIIQADIGRVISPFNNDRILHSQQIGVS